MGRPPIRRKAMSNAERRGITSSGSKLLPHVRAQNRSTGEAAALKARIKELEAAMIKSQNRFDGERQARIRDPRDYNRLLNAQEGVFTAAQYKFVLCCLHPNHFSSDLADRFTKAFALFSDRKDSPHQARAKDAGQCQDAPHFRRLGPGKGRHHRRAQAQEDRPRVRPPAEAVVARLAMSGAPFRLCQIGRCKSGLKWFWAATELGEGRELYGPAETEEAAIAAVDSAAAEIARDKPKETNKAKRAARPPPKAKGSAFIDYLLAFRDGTGEISVRGPPSSFEMPPQERGPPRQQAPRVWMRS